MARCAAIWRSPGTLPESEVREKALAVPNVAKHLEGKTIRKVIVVPGKIVNIVIS